MITIPFSNLEDEGIPLALIGEEYPDIEVSFFEIIKHGKCRLENVGDAGFVFSCESEEALETLMKSYLLSLKPSL